jgi:hypothetical protein
MRLNYLSNVLVILRQLKQGSLLTHSKYGVHREAVRLLIQVYYSSALARDIPFKKEYMRTKYCNRVIFDHAGRCTILIKIIEETIKINDAASQ